MATLAESFLADLEDLSDAEPAGEEGDEMMEEEDNQVHDAQCCPLLNHHGQEHLETVRTAVCMATPGLALHTGFAADGRCSSEHMLPSSCSWMRMQRSSTTTI